MSQDNRYTNSTNSSDRRRLSPAQFVFRGILLIIVVGLMVVAATLVARNLSRSGTPTEVDLLGLVANPNLSPTEAAALQAYLQLNQGALNTPAGADPTPVSFVVEPGQSASTIASNLFSAHLISNETLFVRYVRYYGLDQQLEAGTFELTATQTIPQIAFTLTDALAQEIVIRFTEGWRREQMAAEIDITPDMPFSGGDFLALTGAGAPLPPGLSFTAELPAGASLEGFLFPDTYNLATDASASELVSRMLTTFDERVTPQLRNDAIAQGLTLYEVVTVASIVEREAVVAEERPTIASVYLNRLQAGIRLEADPTVQYAMGFQPATGQWWNLNLTQSDYSTVVSPYNTYLNDGLPPGPIASPGLASIEAVVYAPQTGFFFFRAACDGSGRHAFATTFEEHVANACQ